MTLLPRKGLLAIAAVVDVALQTGGRPISAKTLATRHGLPPRHLESVLQSLVRDGILKGIRGPRGGYRLMRPLAAIPIADVIAAIDGPIALTACVDGHVGCESLDLCPMRGRWDPVNEAIQHALSAITLADMQEASIPPVFRLPPKPLQAPASVPVAE